MGYIELNAIKSITKIKEKGILIIDNINRYIPIIDTYSPNSINDISLIEDNWANFKFNER